MEKCTETETMSEDWASLISHLEERREWALRAGGQRRIDREHALGRLTARERIDRLADPGTFVEFGMFVTTPSVEGEMPPSFLCGLARVDGRLVAIGAEDFTVQGGGTGMHLSKVKGGWGGFIEEVAYTYRVPLILLIHGVGGTVAIQEEIGYPHLVSAEPIFPIAELLTRVPVIAAVMGPTAGSSAARAGMSHFSVMTKDQACLFAGGPPLVKQALGLDIDKLDLGGSQIHTVYSGLIDNEAIDDEDAIDQARIFLEYMPGSVDELPPRAPFVKSLERQGNTLLDLMPTDTRAPFDVRPIVEEIVDEDSFFEVAENFGDAVITGMARIGGYPVGVIASNPLVNAGALDRPASEKQARFTQMCDTFHLPIVYFADVPGFMIGPEAERSGVMRAGIRAVHAIQMVTVPVYTIQIRRSYGLAAAATGNANPQSMHFAWPTGIWGDLPLEAGLEAAHGAELAAAEDPEALRAELKTRYENQNSPWRTIKKFGIEDIIDPRDTRMRLFSMLELAGASAKAGEKNGPTYRP
ncbi:MAG: propionyl-CoA carboxylase [Herbiconiux sp.]|uniref:acyl-CoA carboxylase subunit beta n=1 Tax=Herbiconiux sp. TaxID=1871186 RepID=UPI00122852F2|nr:carboxyl transferase domain-containing protein [Herbiconiux sp.]TAJ46906.1 MAG: propionyl-CoA carboxylase [Herbiconiux sp.]